eukprot:scaffold469_cov391-Prasinococcus_capsulatus_cf.AAC.2
MSAKLPGPKTCCVRTVRDTSDPVFASTGWSVQEQQRVPPGQPLDHACDRHALLIGACRGAAAQRRLQRLS